MTIPTAFSSAPFHKFLNSFRGRAPGLRSFLKAVQKFVERNTSYFGKILFVLSFMGAFIGGSVAADGVPSFAFSAGETFRYDIHNLGLKVGEATVVFQGPVQVDGHKAFLLTVTSQGFRFFDEEKIYVDPATFLPLRVERYLDVFGRKERIVEYYDALKGGVRIVKTVKGKTSQQVIGRGKILDNIYPFVFRYRKSGTFRVGEKLRIHLPTRDVEFILEKSEPLKVGGKDHTAYYMHSVPKGYRVWFDQSPHKIPLRLDGAIGFGKTSMVLREYHR